MKAVVWHGQRDVRVDRVPDPVIQEPTDAIVRLTSTAICGSDLHLYEVLGPFLEAGDILGHEPMGIVEEVGPAVTHLRPGDRVVVPFNIACGDCFMCGQDLYSQCETTQVEEYGCGAALFGYTKLYGQVPGGQAEYLRVPQAHFGPIKVPEGPADERFLYLPDVLPTAMQAVAYAQIPPGGSVAVLGLGPIGQMSARIARQQGARVVAVEPVAERAEMARRHGIEVLDAGELDAVGDAIRDLTGGRGTDSVIDAVGMEAHGSPAGELAQKVTGLLPGSAARAIIEKAGVDRLNALLNAIEIHMHMGQANVKRWVDDLMPYLTTADDPLGVEDLATHRLPLDEAPRAYEMFQKKQDGAIKVVLEP